VTVIIGVITYFGCSLISIDGVVGLILKTLLCIALPNILYLLVYRNTKIFKEVVIFMKKLLPNLLK